MKSSKMRNFSILKSMYKACFNSSEGLSIRKLKNRIKKKIYLPVVYTVEDEQIGFTITKPFENGIHIEYLGVSPKQQGKGYGKKILDSFQCGITLECSTLLLPFYQKMGFKELQYFNKYHFMYKNMSTYQARTIVSQVYLLNLLVETLNKEIKKGEQEEIIEYEKNKLMSLFLFRDITKT